METTISPLADLRSALHGSKLASNVYYYVCLSLSRTVRTTVSVDASPLSRLPRNRLLSVEHQAFSFQDFDQANFLSGEGAHG